MGTTITISDGTYQKLLKKKLVISADKGKKLTWDDFFQLEEGKNG